MEFVGCAAGLQEVRDALDGHGEAGLHPPPESDPLRWDWNGFGPYNRADIDVFVTASTIEQADEKVRAMHSTTSSRVSKEVNFHAAYIEFFEKLQSLQQEGHFTADVDAQFFYTSNVPPCCPTF